MDYREVLGEEYDILRSRAINGSAPVWAAFQKWEMDMVRSNEGILPRPSFDNFRVSPDSQENAIYGDGVWDNSKPKKGDNIRRNYFGEIGDLETSRTYCEALNSGDRETAFRIKAKFLLEEMTRKELKLFAEHLSREQWEDPFL